MLIKFSRFLSVIGFLSVSATAGAQTTQPTTQPTAALVDHSDPAAVVEAIFAAARTGDLAPLAGLCDPQGENDGDTRDICGVAAEEASREQFVAYFQDGSVSGEVAIEGTQAQVPILFGPGGQASETMILIQRDGAWYLSSF